MSNRLPIVLGVLWLFLSALVLGNELGRQPEIQVRWVTETEMNTAGFNLYRASSSDGPFEKINDQLILSQGDPLLGAEYEYSDPIVSRGQTYYYQLEEVEVNGDLVKLDMIHAQVEAVRPLVVVLAAAGLVIGAYLLLSTLYASRSMSKTSLQSTRSTVHGLSEDKASHG